MTHRYTILGAGLAGLSAGYNLAEGGSTISILEKERYVGGLAASFTIDGYTFDLGPHRFYTKNKRVMDQVVFLFGKNAHYRDRLSRIFMLGKFFDYPLKASNVVKSLPPGLLVRSFWDYMVVRVKNRFHPIPDDCFQNWVLKRFGKTLYRLFFGTYTEKAWGIPCTQISADWASQRITLLNLWDTVVKTLFKPKNEPRTLVSKFIYPMHGGVGEMSKRYSDLILAANPQNRVLTGVDIQRIRWEGDRITSVEFTRPGSGGKVETEDVDQLISTIPITTAIDLFDPAPPEEILQARRSLRYKAIVFVFLALDRDKVTDDHWIYLPEQHLKVHRISEFKNFSEHCAPPGKTLIAAEITCNYEDYIWNMGKDDLVDLAAGDLEKVGLIKKAEVTGAYIHRERFSYPLYDLTYRDNVKQCLTWMKGRKNWISTGRQGLFKYGNMDHSIAMGLLLAERLLKGEGDHEKVLESDEYLG